MPRVFSTAIQGEIDKQFAGEPMVIVEINWAGNFVAYSDRKLNDEEYPYPLIVSIGKFDTTQVVSGGSDSQSVSLVLNDTDGSIRAIIDTQDIHLRPVRAYLTFQGLPFSEKALMFEGVINSPIEWDEAGRTLSFSVFSKLEDSEAGFTMEDGDFPFVPPSEANKPWPLVFGQVCNMEAVQVTALRKGFLAQGVGVPDPTLEERLCQAKFLQCPLISTTDTMFQDPNGIPISNDTEGVTAGNQPTEFRGGGADGAGGTFASETYNTVQTIDVNARRNVRNGKVDKQCVSKKFGEICKILGEKAAQEQYAINPFIVRGGEDFPQNQKITIKIDEVRFEGIMTGEAFLVSQTFHPQLDTISNPPCKEINGASLGYRYEIAEDQVPTDIVDCSGGGTVFNRDVRDGSGESWRYYNLFEAGDFIWLPPGTDVFLADESDIVNIVSLIPGTVDQVAAYRTFGDTSLLTEVDTSKYTVNNTNYGGYQVVEIWLDSPLSTIEDEKWDDELYVSFTSTIGPNPADTIQWLVEKYTDYTVDATSFAAVKSSLTNYPSNFFVKKRPSVLKLIKDIAYQARCGVFIRDNIVYLVYLSTEPTSIKTLTESDIITQSFKFSHTETEDLETRHEITWSEGEAGVNKDDKTEFEFILKHNIPKYGIFEKSYDYFTQNIIEVVKKSATFWMIRKANTWRMVEFETPAVHLNIDVFDCVILDIAQFPTTKVVIEEANYDIDSNTIKFKAWTPILSGTSTPYTWAWPSQQSATQIFPLDGSQGQSGDGYQFQVIPPVGHPLRGGYDSDTAVLATDGDKNPSDLDDAFPSLTCKQATGAEIAPDVEPIIRIIEPLAQKNFEDKMDNKEAPALNGGGGSNESDEEKTACGQPIQGEGGCIYEVLAWYIRPTQVTSKHSSEQSQCADGGPCVGGGGSTGRACTGAFYSFCHTFGALFAAQQFKAGLQAEYDFLFENCLYQVDKMDTWQPGNITAIEGTGPFGECDDVSIPGDPSKQGADKGQTAKPKQNSGDPATSPSPSDLPGDSGNSGAGGVNPGAGGNNTGNTK